MLLLLPPDHTKAEKFLFRLAHDTFGIYVATGLAILAGACAWAAKALLGLSGSTITTVLIYAAAAVAVVGLVAVTLGLRRVLAVRSTSDEELFRETNTRLQGLEAFGVGGDEYLAAWQAIYDEIAVLRTVP